MKRIILIIVAFFSLSILFNCAMAQNENKPEQNLKLIYFGDPMCSWCYGFAPEIEMIEQQFKNIPFEIVLGGLRPNGKQTMSELSGFLQEHWQQIEQQTDQKFNYDILQLDDFVYNTEPASRAVEVARTIDPTITLSFFKAVQTAFYFANKSTHDINTYLNIAKQYNLDEEQFEKLFYSKKIIEKTQANFEKSAEMGVRGFPALILKEGDKLHLITNGYQKATKLIPIIKGLVGE